MPSKSLGTLTLDLVAKTGGFTGPIDKAARTSKQKMQDIEADAKSAAAGIGAIATAAGVVGGALVAFTATASNNARELKNQAALANASTAEFQRMSYASLSVGVEQEKLADILKDVNDRVGDFISTGGGEMAEFFEKIAPRVGVTAEQFAKLSGPEALGLYVRSLERAGLSQQEMTFYMEAVADDATRLIPLLKDGGRGLAELTGEADSLGIVLSDVQVNALSDFANQTDRVTGLLSAAGNVIAAEMAPALSAMVDELVEIAVAFQEGEYDQQIDLITKIGEVAAGAAIAYGTYRAAIAAATIAQWAFNAAAAANPIGLLVVAVGSAAGALYAFRDELGITGSETHQTAIDVEGLAAAFDELTAAEQRNRRSKMAGDLAEMRLEADKLQTELAGLQKLVEQSGQLTPQGGALPVASPEDLARGRKLRDELGKLTADIAAGEQVLTEYDAIMAGLGGTTEETTRRIRKSSEELSKIYSGASYDSLLGMVDADQRGKEVIAAQQAEFEATRRALDERYAIEQEYQDRVKALRAGNATGVDVSALLIEAEKQKNEQLLALNGDYWAQYLAAAEENLTSFDELAGNMLENFSGRFGAAFESMVFDAETLGDAIDGLAEGMARSVVSAIGEMLAQWVALQAVQLATGQSAQAAAVAGAAVAGTAIASAYAPAAAMASLASFGANAVPAAAAITSTTALAETLSLAGMAHDGIDSVPTSGTWNLEKGERVTTAETSAKLDRTLDDVRRNQRAGSGGAEVTNVFQISVGVAGTVRAEFMKLMPMIEERSKASVLAAINGGGAMSRATGRRS